MASSNQIRSDVHRLRDEGVTQEYKRELAETPGELNDSADPDKLRTELNTKFLKVSEGCLRDTRGTFKSFLTKGTLNIIEESRRVRLDGKTEQ